MKATIERSAFLKSLGHVQSVVERRNTIPILSNVLLRASGSRLNMTATDLDIEIVEGVEATILQEGSTTVPAQTLYDIVRKLPEGSQVELVYESDESRLALSAGRAHFWLPCLPADDFPAMTAGEMAQHFSLPVADIIKLIDHTKFAISTEETRYYLNGIYLHPEESGGKPVLRSVATDGHRLARVQTALPAGAETMPGIIVPRKTVLEVRRLVEDQEKPVQISVSESKIRFEFGDMTLTSKLIDGTFPDYSRVIPTDNDKVLFVEGHDFARAVDRVATISTEKSRAIKLVLDAGRLTLAVNNPETGSASEELSSDYAAEPLEIGFNSKYLLDVLAQIDGGTAKFEFADAGSPTVISNADDQEQQALYVLMPMRV